MPKKPTKLLEPAKRHEDEMRKVAYGNAVKTKPKPKMGKC